MGKTLETKREILSRLREQRKTVTQLSRELGLSKATVSQHLSELRSMGAVEEDDNRYFRRLKYFRIRQQPRGYGAVDRLLAAIAVVAAAGIVFSAAALSGGFPGTLNGSGRLAVAQNHNLTAAAGRFPAASASACPMQRHYGIANRSAVGAVIMGIANGSSCYLVYVNTTSRTLSVGPGVQYTSRNGTITVPSLNYTYSLTRSQRSALEPVGEGYCWQYAALEVFGINVTGPMACSPGQHN